MKGVFVLLALVGFALVFYSFVGQVKTVATVTHAASTFSDLEVQYKFKATDPERERLFQPLDHLQRCWWPVAILGFVILGLSCTGWVLEHKRGRKA